MNNDLEGMRKEAVVALFEVLPRHSPTGTDNDYEKQP
jgi:hypothetical protein